MSLIKRIIKVFRETYLFQFIFGNRIRVCDRSSFEMGARVSIRNSRIFVTGKARVIIKDDSRISNVDIFIDGGELTIGKSCILVGTNLILNNESTLQCGHHTKIAGKRIWIRFGGRLQIGNYTNINSGSEIRCDEKISIGNYCQISYNVNIWDTNTHSILPTEQRKELAEHFFPYYGYETSKPSASPISIGDFCWLGEGSGVMKGSKLRDNVIVGYHTTIFGKTIDSNSTVVSDTHIKVL